MRSATAITSCSLCVITITQWPSRAMSRSVSKSCSASCGVSTAVGSSRTRMREPRKTAFMISTRCCSPTESCQMRASGSTPMRRASDTSCTWRRPAFACRATGAACASRGCRFSATVSGSTSRKCWCTIPIPASSASRGAWSSTGSPKRRISPSSGRYRPVRTFMSVVFPAPFSPRRACTSPVGGLEVDPLVRDHAREALRDAPHRDGGDARGAGRAGASRDGVVRVRANPSRFRSCPSRASPSQLLLQRQRLALRDAELPALVVERARRTR